MLDVPQAPPKPGLQSSDDFADQASNICSLESPYPVGDSHSTIDLDPACPANSTRFDPPQVKLENRGITPHLQTLLWSRYTVWKNSIAVKLREAGNIERASKLESCHTQYTFAICRACNLVQKFPNRCDQLFCPECQPRLQRERQSAIEWWTREVSQPKHVVLTVRNSDVLSKESIKEFKRWWTNLRRTKFASNWLGGFYSIECTNEGKGWHLHLHALVNAKWIDGGGLSKTWAKCTNGNGFIVKVKDARGSEYLHEVTKYVAKGSQIASWSPSDILTFIEAFDGVRTFGVFGQLYGLRTKFAEWFKQLRDAKPRCTCGSCEVSYYDEHAFLMLDLLPDSQAHPIPPPTIECLTPWLALEFPHALPPR